MNSSHSDIPWPVLLCHNWNKISICKQKTSTGTAPRKASSSEWCLFCSRTMYYIILSDFHFWKEVCLWWQLWALCRSMWEAWKHSLAFLLVFSDSVCVFVRTCVQVGVSWQPCTVWCSLTSLAWTSSDPLCWRCWRGDGRTAVSR